MRRRLRSQPPVAGPPICGPDTCQSVSTVSTCQSASTASSGVMGLAYQLPTEGVKTSDRRRWKNSIHHGCFGSYHGPNQVFAGLRTRCRATHSYLTEHVSQQGAERSRKVLRCGRGLILSCLESEGYIGLEVQLLGRNPVDFTPLPDPNNDLMSTTLRFIHSSPTGTENEDDLRFTSRNPTDV